MPSTKVISEEPQATRKRGALRMRIFAGPNGSGKSTIIQAIREYRIKEIPIDFGIYINADDIAELLRSNQFRFSDYRITTSRKEFTAMAISSGLVGTHFPEKTFRSSFWLKRNQQLLIKDRAAIERLAQILSDFLRQKLLRAGEKFSFETVFSHPSKLEIMHEANQKGYKVYLYFVATESPEINIYRVQVRKDKGGHDVPAAKIRSRYDRALDLMFEASQRAYQAYFFDNSGEQPKLFAHFKNLGGKRNGTRLREATFPSGSKGITLQRYDSSLNALPNPRRPSGGRNDRLRRPQRQLRETCGDIAHDRLTFLRVILNPLIPPISPIPH